MLLVERNYTGKACCVVTILYIICRMVRFYKRKSTRGKYGMENLEKALTEVKAGKISRNKAEQIYGVPRKTLNRHLQDLVAKPGQLGRFSSVLGVDF